MTPPINITGPGRATPEVRLITLVQALRRIHARHEKALWLGPILLLVGTIAAATVRGAL